MKEMELNEKRRSWGEVGSLKSLFSHLISRKEGDEKRIKFENLTNNFLFIFWGRQHSYNKRGKSIYYSDSINKREKMFYKNI